MNLQIPINFIDLDLRDNYPDRLVLCAFIQEPNDPDSFEYVKLTSFTNAEDPEQRIYFGKLPVHTYASRLFLPKNRLEQAIQVVSEEQEELFDNDCTTILSGRVAVARYLGRGPVDVQELYYPTFMKYMQEQFEFNEILGLNQK